MCCLPTLQLVASGDSNEEAEGPGLLTKVQSEHVQPETVGLKEVNEMVICYVYLFTEYQGKRGWGMGRGIFTHGDVSLVIYSRDILGHKPQ
jgi:hypothetical protein